MVRMRQAATARATVSLVLVVVLGVMIGWCRASPQYHHGRHHESHPSSDRLYMAAANNFDPHRDSEEFRRDDERREFTRRDSFVTDHQKAHGDDPLVVQTKKGRVRGMYTFIF